MTEVPQPSAVDSPSSGAPVAAPGHADGLGTDVRIHPGSGNLLFDKYCQHLYFADTHSCSVRSFNLATSPPRPAPPRPAPPRGLLASSSP
eukprot:tig00000254_g22575.t1